MVVQKQAIHIIEEIRVICSNQGESLLSGNVLCTYCGARLSLTANGKYRRRADGTIDNVPNIRYVC